MPLPHLRSSFLMLLSSMSTRTTWTKMHASLTVITFYSPFSVSLSLSLVSLASSLASSLADSLSPVKRGERGFQLESR